MDAWHREIVELHEFFEGYFLGRLPADDLSRLEAALADDFSFLGPDGVLVDRAGIVHAIREGFDHSETLVITITEPTLLVDDGSTVVARYVENHEFAGGGNHRLSTVVFTRDDAAPNGLRWRTTHETWLAGTRD